MKRLNCLIIDDEPIAREGIADYCKQVSFLKVLALCKNALQANQFLKENEIDVVFLDINMPRLSGFDMLRALHKKPNIIVTTAYSEYAIKGFELSVTDYLLKPFSFERFVQATEKVIERNSESQKTEAKAINTSGKYIFVKSGKKMVKIESDKIVYFESMGNYITIHTKENQITSKQTLSQFQELLPKDKFIRIHRSFVVSIKSILYLEGNKVFIKNKSLPIGKVFKENLLKVFR